MEFEAQLKDQVAQLKHDQNKTNRRVNVISSKMESEMYLGNALRGVIHRLNKFCNSCLKRVEHFSRRLQQFEGNLNTKKKRRVPTDALNKRSCGVLEALIEGLCESEMEKGKIIRFAEEILQGLQNTSLFTLEESKDIGRSRSARNRNDKRTTSV